MSKLALRYSQLTTEQTNPRTVHIDQANVKEILKTITNEDKKIVWAVAKEHENIAKAIALIVRSLQRGGRLFFVGAGTSGRLGVLEAAECPPTFHTKHSQVQAMMAGGRNAVFKSQEGAEDLSSSAAVKKRVRPEDVVVGIAASGVTPFVLSALKTAKKLGCSTILITCNKSYIPCLAGRQAHSIFHIRVSLEVGPEIIAGSTRMKAATATKMALNMLTTASMIRLGKVYGNRMVDLQIKSRKLKERAIRILKEVAGLNRSQALHYIRSSRGHVKTAILMAKKELSYNQARQLLKTHQGFLGQAMKP